MGRRFPFEPGAFPRGSALALAIVLIAPRSRASPPEAPSLTGSSGLCGVASADIGDAYDLQVALRGEILRARDLLIAGDVDTRAGGILAAACTLNRHLELFGGVRALDNRDHQTLPGGTTHTASALDGGLLLGGKLVTRAARSLAGGGEIAVELPLDGSSRARSASFWVGLLGTLDLSALTALPLQVHVNAGFLDDHSKRGYALTGLSVAERAVVMFGHGLGVSRGRFAVGIAAPLHGRLRRIGLEPFLEYHLEVATSDADPAFQDRAPFNPDQQRVTLGMRARVLQRLTVDAGVDLLVRPVAPAYGPPSPPYNVIVGVSMPLARQRREPAQD